MATGAEDSLFIVALLMSICTLVLTIFLAVKRRELMRLREQLQELQEAQKQPAP